MGSVFRIISVEEDKEGIWIVKLKLTGEENGELRQLVERGRLEMSSTIPRIALPKLLISMGNYKGAEGFFLSALKDPSILADPKMSSIIHNDLGLIYEKIGNPEKSVEHYQTAVNIVEERGSADDQLLLAPTYSNLGSYHLGRKAYDTAISFYSRAMDITVKSPKQCLTTAANAAVYISNIGTAHLLQEHYSEALDHLSSALQIQELCLPPNHPSYAINYTNIAQVYSGLGEKEKQIEYLNKALAIQLQSLPAGHLDFSNTFKNLALALAVSSGDRLEEALGYAKIAYEIRLQHLPPNHPEVRDCRWTISLLDGLNRKERTITLY
ncbi:unnamed protein product [Didymodactylos carnosus]|uniref:Kinesin light chain n=1 Tax=Didymodactylos carnosus TaxID=1234261 RepID=A0A814Q020_9BILA|nr:unnamed protein product [Didymodactylos carnosus]CAF1304734.1 unnamed protein product [Didymodactylos carnosus]CAF3876824.1 unnamed protein product [Didymodactylos carnosus]CAF4111593.1 unnamed protein product [Didymodactylos carnosus]